MNNGEIEKISENIKQAQAKLGFSVVELSSRLNLDFSKLFVTTNQLSKNIQAALDHSL